MARGKLNTTKYVFRPFLSTFSKEDLNFLSLRVRFWRTICSKSDLFRPIFGHN